MRQNREAPAGRHLEGDDQEAAEYDVDMNAVLRSHKKMKKMNGGRQLDLDPDLSIYGLVRKSDGSIARAEPALEGGQMDGVVQ